MKIGYGQFFPVFGEYDANVATLEKLAQRGKDADLLVFPELAVSGYDFVDKQELAKMAEPFREGPTSRLGLQLAQKYQCSIVIGYPEKDGDKMYNSCLLATSEGQLSNYRKIHLFSRETTIFEPGNLPPTVVDIGMAKVGLMICFDWVFPETARLLALNGAQIIAHPANLVLQFCQKAMFARCVENGVFAVTANRIGTEERTGRKLTFTGASQVLNNKGSLLAQAPDTEEHVAVVEIQPQDALNKNITPENHLFQSRRINLYDDLLKE